MFYSDLGKYSQCRFFFLVGLKDKCIEKSLTLHLETRMRSLFFNNTSPISSAIIKLGENMNLLSMSSETKCRLCLADDATRERIQHWIGNRSIFLNPFEALES